MVSVVLPVYNERDNLAPLLRELHAVLEGCEHEIVAVDDRSTDGSLEELRCLRGRYPALRVVALSAHAGQSAAFAAGFDTARGDVVVTMDADGQNDPQDIPTMLGILTGDRQLAGVVGYRVARADSWWKRLQSRIANVIRSRLTGDRIRDTGCSLKAVRREALLRMPRFDGMHRFFPALLLMDGWTIVETPVTHRPRMSGASKYGLWNRVGIALHDAFGVSWLGKRRLVYHADEDVT
jgi:glycosyltransferase involved in cell wall biosynthesis